MSTQADEIERIAKAMTDPRHAAYTARIKKMSAEDRLRLLALAKPRIIDEYMVHIPHPKQQVFLSLQQEEAMYGGAAGGGKSDALLMAALQYVDVPGYSALILRRTWPDLNAAGAILDRANTWFVNTRAQSHDGGRVWSFPTATEQHPNAAPARISFGYLQHEKDKYKFQSAEYQFVAFDELTQFEETQYSYLFSRIRRPMLSCLNCGTPVRKYHSGWHHTKREGVRKCRHLLPDPMVLDQFSAAADGTTLFDVPLRMRSASNPGGVGHEWVKTKFIDKETRDKDAVFIPAMLPDNPSLDRDSYIQNLLHLGAVDRERLMAGDWAVMEQGEQFERHWFNVVDDVPVTRQICRYWDFAATENATSDWTVGAKVILDKGKWFIDDIIRIQGSPNKVERLVQQTAALDGRDCAVRIEQEGGSAGLHVIDHYRRNVLVGYNFDGVRPTGSKSLRATGWAKAAEAGNVAIRKARWNKTFLDEITLFPYGAHDDQVDAVSGATEFLAFYQKGRLVV